eukprot:6181192-Pleurochrysis_carterae.AAC.2
MLKFCHLCEQSGDTLTAPNSLVRLLRGSATQQRWACRAKGPARLAPVADRALIHGRRKFFLMMIIDMFDAISSKVLLGAQTKLEVASALRSSSPGRSFPF